MASLVNINKSRRSLRAVWGILLYFVIAIAFANEGLAQSVIDQAASKSLNSLKKSLTNHNVSKVEVIWLDPTVESRNTVTSEVLDKIYERKLELRKFDGTEVARSLAKALSSTTLYAFNPKLEGDVRWGLKFTLVGEKEAAFQLYLSDDGKSGELNKTKVTIQGALHGWLESNLGRCIRIRK